MNNNSIIEMFGDSAGCMERDMNVIVGRKELTAEQIKKQLDACNAFLATQGRGGSIPDPIKIKQCQDFINKYAPQQAAESLNKQIQDCLVNVQIIKVAYKDAEGNDVLDPDWERQRAYCREFLISQGVSIPGENGGPAAPVAFSMLSFSSPVNTIVKSLFLLSLSPMFAGSNHFYFLSVGCAGAIIYSLFKLSNR